MTTPIFRSPSAWVPIGMSILALAIVAVSLSLPGAARQPDEGTAARLWQLLMVGQLPFMAWFLARKARHDPRRGAVVLAVQLGAVLAAAAPVYVLGL